MKTKYSITISLLTILLFCSYTNQNGEWQKSYNKNGLVIFTRTTDSGLKEFQAKATLDATVGEIAAIFKDWKAHPEWMRTMTKAELVEQSDAKTRYLYYVIDFPWPLSNRDMVTKSRFSKKEDNSVVMKVWCKPKKKKEQKNLVRIEEAEGFWKLIPLKDGKTKAIYQYKADPVGIPNWIVNMFLLEGPKESFFGLREQIKKKKYKEATLDWLDKD